MNKTNKTTTTKTGTSSHNHFVLIAFLVDSPIAMMYIRKIPKGLNRPALGFHTKYEFYQLYDKIFTKLIH